MVGYVGSGDCLAVAPVAEEMKKFLILFDCGTPRIFEDGKYKYVFRTASHATHGQRRARPLPEGAQRQGRHLQPDQPGLRLGPGLAQRLQAAMDKLFPGAKAEADLLPKFGAGQYGTEISALMAAPADVDPLEPVGRRPAGVHPAGARRAACSRSSQVVLSAADHVLPGLGDKMPDGVILGARGAYGLMSPKTPLNDWWWNGYQGLQRRLPGAGAVPHGAGAARPEARGREGDGRQRRQEAEPASSSPRRSRTSNGTSPGGRIRMALGERPPGDPGHGDRPDPVRRRRRRWWCIEDIQRFPAECVNPPRDHEVPRTGSRPASRARSATAAAERLSRPVVDPADGAAVGLPSRS